MATETSKAGNKPGVYTHKATGRKLTATNEAVADGLVRLAFERTGDVPKRETKKVETKEAKK